MTSLAPISSEDPSSVVHQNQRIRHILVIMYNVESRQHMDGGAKKLRRIGNFKKIGFSDDGEMKLYFLLILCCPGVNSTELVRQPRTLKFQRLS